MRITALSHAARAAALGCLLSLGACAAVQTAGPASVAGMAPSGTVQFTEVTAAGGAAGSGILTFRGRSYSFKLAGGVTGGGGAANMQAYGEVFGLNNLSDFNGVYNQTSGGVGLATSGSSELWLVNRMGVIMHLTGVQQGMVLSLGRDEILITLL